MSFGADAANLAGGSPAAAPGRMSPTWPARAEGEKRFRSAIRNPYAAIHKSGVMVKSPPTPAFIVPQSELLFEFFVVAFDDPAMFGQLCQSLQGSCDG